MSEGEPISVPKEVAEFLEQDGKREQAEAKRELIQLCYREGLSLEKIGAIREAYPRWQSQSN